MPEDERATAQMRKVYELLIKPHPSYHNFLVEGDWAFAQKRIVAPSMARELATETVIQTKTVHVGLGAALIQLAKAVLPR